MSRPRIIDIVRTRGDTYYWEYTVAADLTGYTVVFTVNSLEEPPDDSTQVFQITCTVPSITATESTVRVGPFAAGEEDTEPGDYFYDVEATAGPVIRTFIRGKYTIEQDITK